MSEDDAFFKTLVVENESRQLATQALAVTKTLSQNEPNRIRGPERLHESNARSMDYSA